LKDDDDDDDDNIRVITNEHQCSVQLRFMYKCTAAKMFTESENVSLYFVTYGRDI